MPEGEKNIWLMGGPVTPLTPPLWLDSWRREESRTEQVAPVSRRKSTGFQNGSFFKIIFSPMLSLCQFEGLVLK